MTVVLAQTWWIWAGVHFPGLIVVLALIGFALARVVVAVGSPAGEQRPLERQLYRRALPFALLSTGVVILRFAELAK
jgi:hypothetical protein